MSSLPKQSRPHILSIALEDYFHGPAFRKRIGAKRWSRFETRFEANCLRLLDQLGNKKCRATFFANVWVAQQRSDLIREVIARGHEVALAAARGSSFRFLSPEQLREQVRTQRDLLQEACGKQILGFRSSDVHLRAKDLWALKVLAEERFVYDSSLNPLGMAFVRQPWRRFIHEEQFRQEGSGANEPQPLSIYEVPLSSFRLGPVMLPMAGGNYYRQYPEALVRGLLRRWDGRLSEPLVLYLRLWDFDPEQPRMETGSVVGNLRHYRNGDRMVRTIDHLFENYRFISIAQQLGYDQETLAMPVLTHAVSGMTLLPATEGKSGEAVPVSLIVPCFNEEASIPYLSRALGELQAALAPRFCPELVLVDDGSTDQTWATLQRCFAGRADVRLIRLEKNTGVSGAIQAGLQASREIACSMDCDCSYDPFELIPMLSLLQPGVDLVTASPYHPQGLVLNVPRWRLLLSGGASALYRIATGSKLNTFTSCLRVYRRSAILRLPLRHTGFLGVAEIAGRLALQGHQTVEYPTTLESRIFGRSKMKIARTVIGHLGLLSRLAWTRMWQPMSKHEVALTPRTDQETPKTISEVSL